MIFSTLLRGFTPRLVLKSSDRLQRSGDVEGVAADADGGRGTPNTGKGIDAEIDHVDVGHAARLPAGANPSGSVHRFPRHVGDGFQCQAPLLPCRQMAGEQPDDIPILNIRSLRRPWAALDYRTAGMYQVTDDEVGRLAIGEYMAGDHLQHRGRAQLGHMQA